MNPYDRNARAFRTLMQDDGWCRSNKGKFVVLVGGEVVGVGGDRIEVLRQARDLFPHDYRFIGEVATERRVAHLPTPVVTRRPKP